MYPLSLYTLIQNVIIAKPVDNIKKVEFNKVVNSKVKVDMYLHDLIENTA